MMTQESTVSFFSEAVLEDITATTSKAQGILNLENGEFFFDGDMYQVTPTRYINLREQAMISVRKELLTGVDVRDMIVFSPEGQTKGVINVFTDVDCGYCRKLHREVPELNKHGIEVRYLAFPRAGIGRARVG